eukprot:8500365-Heterocapsa_arctica.AAC.1
MIHTAENTRAANDAVFQFVLPGMLRDMGLDRGFADSALEKQLHDSLKDDGCFRHVLPRLGVTRFFAVLKRFEEHDSHEWHER